MLQDLRAAFHGPTTPTQLIIPKWTETGTYVVDSIAREREEAALTNASISGCRRPLEPAPTCG
jgi:hypothetical protein